MIQMHIKDESELYNKYDPNRMRINDEAFNYLKSYCTEPEAKKHTFDKLQIISDVPVDAGQFQQALRASVQREQAVFETQMETNTKRAIWGYIAGVLLSVAGFLIASLMDQVLLALISFFGTMILSESVTIGTKINPDIKKLRDRLDPLLQCEIEIVLNNHI